MRQRKQLYVQRDCGFGTDCWLVTGYLTNEGYGTMVDNEGKQRAAHIVMWERHHGPVPAGLQLDHLCRQPACIRPSHLESVTNAVNVRRSRTAKLTVKDVIAIRARLGSVSQSTIAREHGVCQATIGHIATGRNWKPETMS